MHFQYKEREASSGSHPGATTFIFPAISATGHPRRPLWQLPQAGGATQYLQPNFILRYQPVGTA